MPDLTALWAVPYIVGAEAANTIDDAMQALAERVDVLLGETGLATITPSAIDTQTQLVVMYGRTYPTVPRVMLERNFASGALANRIDLWPSNELVDRFTLNIRSYNTAARDVRWLARPQP